MEIERRALAPFCRGCLTSHRVMESLHKNPLKEDFFKITNIEINECETLSSWLCIKCSLLFHQLQAFKKRASLINTLLLVHAKEFQINFEEYEIIEEKYRVDNPIQKQNNITLLQACADCNDIAISSNIISDCHVEIKVENYIDKCNGENKPMRENQNSVKLHFENDDTHLSDDFIIIDTKDQFNGNMMEVDEVELKPRINETDNSVAKRKMSFGSIDMSKVLVIEVPLDDQLKEMEKKRSSEGYCNAKYKCEHCVKVFPFEDSLKCHMERHKESYGICECSICRQRFTDLRILKNHLATHRLRYRCRLCNRQFHFKNSVTDHLLKHDNIYLCRICGHQSNNKASSQLHQKTHSSGEISICDICLKVFGHKRAFDRHMRRHTGNMSFSCEECGKHFQTNAMLTVHKSVHSNMRNFYCELCDVSFKTRDIMLAHFKRSSRHVDPSSLNYPCELCVKRFKNQSQLKAHVDNFHLRQVRMACDICPARFVSLNGLRNHQKRKHQGVKPKLTHICETCGRAFSTKALVTNHIRTHTGEKPFKCEKCNKSFTQKSAMTTHYKIIHLKEKREKKDRKKKMKKTETEIVSQ